MSGFDHYADHENSLKEVVSTWGKKYSFTRGEIMQAFRLVEDSTNWKNPISKIVVCNTERDRVIISEAIGFLTGAYPSKVTELGNNAYHFKAAGYYATCGA
jgi:hypothetical protein